jgi:hypothetical protein
MPIPRHHHDFGCNPHPTANIGQHHTLKILAQDNKPQTLDPQILSINIKF